jgi:hypothetical protein
VQAVLVGEGQVDASRVFVTAAPAEKPQENTKAGEVRMELSLS